jgi:hypothetical protein
VHWWQWVLQVTGAWFYVALIAAWLWIVVKRGWSERRKISASGAKSASEFLRSRTPDDITPLNVAAVADAFLEACKYARGVLPKLQTGVAFHDDKDTGLIAMINEAGAAREAISKTWPKVHSELTGKQRSLTTMGPCATAAHLAI